MPESNQFSAPLSPSPSPTPSPVDPALQPRLVVTDLDGSLLDHHSYDFSPAAPWLARLKQMGVPVIPVNPCCRRIWNAPGVRVTPGAQVVAMRLWGLGGEPLRLRLIHRGL